MATFLGIKFPFGFSTSSFPAASEDQDLIRESLVQIITTTPGERVMRPDFGSRVYSFIFENNNELMAELIRSEVSAVIAKYEPRVSVTSISSLREDNEITIQVNYIVKLTGQQDSVSITTNTNQ